MSQPLMPFATAVWLVENTGLTFQQIADYCGLHLLEVQAIADDTVQTKMVGIDPVRTGQLSQADIERCQKNPAARLMAITGPEQAKRTKGPRYTPVSRRQDKPDAIAWLLRYHPELKDSQISKLIGTTKHTISGIRDKSHWNIQAIKPQDPVALGLCSQRELDALVSQANKDRAAATDAAIVDRETAALEEELRKLRAATRQAEAEAAALAEGSLEE